MELTHGTLLGGRVVFRQPRAGYRTGIEPVLLAASVPAVAGDRVLEAGTGAGAALLCLWARIPGVSGVGVEQDAGLAALARENVAANDAATATVVQADILALPDMPPFDHAMANPPWHPEHGTASPDGMRDRAKRASAGLLADWAAALARALRPSGTMTLVVPAAATDVALAAMGRAGLGGLSLMPLWPRAGQAARLLLLQGAKGSRGACRISPGLVLHEGEGYTAAARDILWEGAALPWP